VPNDDDQRAAATQFSSSTGTGTSPTHEGIALLHRAPYQGPTRRLEFPRDVTMPPVDVTSLGWARPLAPAPVASSSIEDHLPALVGIYMLEIEVLFWLGTRHDEEKVCHHSPPMDSSLRPTQEWKPCKRRMLAAPT